MTLPCTTRTFSGTPQGYVSQIQRPIFSWNPWLGDRSVYWTQHRGANPSRRGTCKFAKWRGSKPLTNPFGCKQRSQNATQPCGKTSSCFSLFFRLPTWLRGDSALYPGSSPTKKRTQHNRAWWSETAPDTLSSWCWQFDCNAPSPPISLSKVLFTNPSVRAGYDTRSIFKRSLTGLNSEFSFS